MLRIIRLIVFVLLELEPNKVFEIVSLRLSSTRQRRLMFDSRGRWFEWLYASCRWRRVYSAKADGTPNCHTSLILSRFNTNFMFPEDKEETEVDAISAA